MFGAALSAGVQSSGPKALDGRAEHWVRSRYTPDQGSLGLSTDQGQGLSGQRCASISRPRVEDALGPGGSNSLVS